MDQAFSWVQALASIFVFVVGAILLLIIVLFVIDVTQTKHTVRRNFPVVGRFRYMFEHMGEFFRQYFFAHDREEMPFNRAQRSWVYRAAKGVDSTVAFGSSLNLTPAGTPIFVNCPYPMLEHEAKPTKPLLIGPYARQPYEAKSFVNVSAMSFGALSKPAVMALSHGSQMAGNWLNTGEGGISPWHLEGGCDIVFQIGTAKYGARDNDGALSDLLDMINRLRDVSGKPVGFKAVIGAYGWLDELFEEINHRGIESAPDFITVDSGDGGTGAAPMSLIDNVGLPIKESLPLVVDALCRHGLRERVRVIASGKLVNPADAAPALCMGADFINTARGFMFALGCIQALQCNKNTCPTGITTHNKRLQRGLVPENKAKRVQRYSESLQKEISMIAHSCGVAEVRGLKRYHCRIVQEDGRSIPMDELYPYI